MTIFWYMPYPVPLVWLIVESNNFCYLSLRHYIVSAKCILHLWGQSEAFSISTNSSWVFTIPCTLGNALFVGFYLTFYFLSPLIMLVLWMVHVNSIKLPLYPVLGTPPPILDISGNIFLWFLDTPVFKIVKSLNITLLGVNLFSVGAGMGSVQTTWAVARK